MGSWSVFRKIRFFIFALICVISLLLTISFTLFASKDFHNYNTLERGIVVGLATLNGITGILMYLMLVVPYSTVLDALRIIVLLLLQAGGTTLFTLRSATIPCNAFGGGKSCKQAAFYIAIISYALCGLLVLYGACLCIMSCVPKQPTPNVIDPGFDEKPPMVQQTRHVPQNSQTQLIGSDIEKQQLQPYSVRPQAPAIRFVDKPRLAQSPMAKQQPQVQMPSYPYGSREQSGHGHPYRPITPSGPPMHFNNSSIDSYRQEPIVPPRASPRMVPPTTSSRRPWPPNAPYTEPIPRATTPGSVYSSLSSVEFATRSTPPPPAAQINPIRRPSQRQSTLSFTTSVYSVGSYYSRDTVAGPPPVPPLRPGIVRATPSPSNEWRDLVMNAAGGRQGASK